MKCLKMSKITRRLILYFGTSLVIFGVIIGVTFALLSSRQNIEVHVAEIERRAVNVADTFARFVFDEGMGGLRGGVPGFRAFVYFIEDIAMSDVWIVDYNLELITFGRTPFSIASYRDLPPGAEQVILDALSGETTTSENFSAFLETETITVATPIIQPNGEIMGAVLLHSEMAGINEVTDRGLLILFFSMITAIVVAFFISIILSSRFTKPLGKMKNAAIQIKEGDYLTTTDVRQDDEIGELAVILDDMAVRLNESSQESAKLEKLRRDFVANISHELRTPLTVIRGSLESLCDGIVKDEVKIKQYHKQMLSESKYLERLVSDLLDLSKLQNIDFKMEMQEIDLKSVADDVIRTMNHIAAEKGIEIKSSFDSDCYFILGDYGRIRQMLIIILDNAVKFSPLSKKVTVSIKKTNTTVKISVSDEGCGIEPSDIPYIFERFYKQRSEENKQGTGLGLAIAKQIADRHGALTFAVNLPDSGAEFSFEFCKAKMP